MNLLSGDRNKMWPKIALKMTLNDLEGLKSSNLWSTLTMISVQSLKCLSLIVLKNYLENSVTEWVSDGEALLL